jgi:VanZ family protein
MNLNIIITDEYFIHEHFDKFAHFCMYFTLSFVFLIENYKYEHALRKYWVIADTILFGIGIEFLQYLTTNYRTGNIYDAIFNTVGVITGTLLFLLLKKQNFVYKLLLFKTGYNK